MFEAEPCGPPPPSPPPANCFIHKQMQHKNEYAEFTPLPQNTTAHCTGEI